MKIRLCLILNLLLLSSYSFGQKLKNFDSLVSTLEIEVKKDGSSIQSIEEVYKVLTEQGRSELSLHKIHFDEAEAKFHFVEAFSLSNGQKFITQQNTLKINQTKATDNFGLSNIAEVIVPFDKITIGSEVHIRYQLFQKPYLGNIFSLILQFSNSSLAKKETYKIISEVPLYYREDNLSPNFSFEGHGQNNKFMIEIKPTPNAYTYEGTKIEIGEFYLTTAASWSQIQQSASKKYLTAVSESLPQALQKIVKDAAKQKSKKDTIEYAARELNKLVTYSGNWTTKDGKLFPQGLKQTLTKGKGDCKDYSTLMAAVLRGLGFDAYPFLTFRSQSYAGSEKLSKLSSLANPQLFNHVIVWAKDNEGKVWWLDPTNPYVQADTITSDILGNFGLILDGRSEKAIFLPSKNLDPADFTLEQTLTLSGDNSVSGSGEMKMSPSAYNSIAMLERLRGPQATKTLINMILNPTSKNTQLDLKKNEGNKPGYIYTFHGTDWVEEDFGKFKDITIFNIVGLSLSKFKNKTNIDIGEPGITKIVTHLRGQKVVDSVLGGCLLRSKWIDLDRIVENKPQEVMVTDLIKTKERFISKTEATGDIFEEVHEKLTSCVMNSKLVLNLSESAKTDEMKELDKIKGPDVEIMTDQNAKALENLKGPTIYSYAALKLFRYYEKKEILKKADAEAFINMGKSVAKLGYLSGDQFIPEHLKEKIRYLDLALRTANGDSEVKAQAGKIDSLLLLKEEKQASQIFQSLYKKYPKHWLTFKMGSNLLNNQKKFDLAEKSLLIGKTFLKNEEDEDDFNRSMYELYSDQKKYSMAIPYQEVILSKNPRNPWALHNLAILYFRSGNTDKCIELEKTAISISSFGAAKGVIAEAYLKKASEVQQNQSRTPSSVNPSYEENLLEALKYNNHNLEALTLLSDHYLQSYKRTKNKIDLQKGRPYLKQAMTVESNNEKVLSLLEQYKKYEKDFKEEG
ncbi:MAG: DUF3857 domain-containing protein [Bdellovibrio sp.]